MPTSITNYIEAIEIVRELLSDGVVRPTNTVATGKLDNAVCPITCNTPRRLARSTNVQSIRHHATTSRRKFTLVAFHWTPNCNPSHTRFHYPGNRRWNLQRRLFSRKSTARRYTAQVLEPCTLFRPYVCTEMILVTTPVHWSFCTYSNCCWNSK